MLISLHLPKTAGTSFRATLETHFGASLKPDYNDIPINRPAWKRNSLAFMNAMSLIFHDFSGTECIHGHFLPLKYRFLEMKMPLTYVTWLRHPVDRVISHYYFWKSHQPTVLPPLHARMIREEWTLERFCLGPEMKDIYHQFFWGFPLKKLSFIGITEYYVDDFAWFCKNFLGSETTGMMLNKNSNSDQPALSKSLRKAIEGYHEKDIALYSWALELRKQRL